MSKEEEKHYLVYWAHLESHTHAKKEGYIGITKDLKERKRQHKKNKKKSVLTDAIKKYSWEKIEWDICHENLSQLEALNLEAEYRPKIRIGWNLQKGGEIGVQPEWYEDKENRILHAERTSIATKEAIAREPDGVRSERAKKIWASSEYKEKNAHNWVGEKNPQYGRFGEKHSAFGHKKSEEVKRRISDAHRGKKLSIATKNKISLAHSIIKTEKEKNAHCLRMSKGELSAIELSEEIGCSTHVIYSLRRWGKEHGYTFPFLYSKKVKENNLFKKENNLFKAENARASKIMDNERHLICARRLKGESYKAISEDYPLGLTGIRSVCTQWGVQHGYSFKAVPAAKRKTLLKYSQKVEIKLKRKNGSTLKELAEEYGVSQTLIHDVSKN